MFKPIPYGQPNKLLQEKITDKRKQTFRLTDGKFCQAEITLEFYQGLATARIKNQAEFEIHTWYTKTLARHTGYAETGRFIVKFWIAKTGETWTFHAQLREVKS